MAFPLGKPVLLLCAVAVVAGAAIFVRPSPGRSDLELWTFAEHHQRLYAKLQSSPADPDIGPRTGELSRADLSSAAFRLIPNNALNVRLVSLFMADRRGADLPDVVEIGQEALGRYLGPPADQVGFLPLNDFLATTGERTIDSADAPGISGQTARLVTDDKIYVHDGKRWSADAKRASADHWIDRVARRRFDPYTKAGRIFGLPQDVHPVTLTYRADLFAEAGVELELPTPGKTYVTWPDFRDRCLRFQTYWRARGKADRWAMDLFSANANVLSALLLQRGANLIEPDGRVRLTDPVVADTLLFYAGLVAGNGRVSADATAAGVGRLRQDLEAGVVCALVTPDWRLADLRASAPSLAGKLRMTRLPKFADADAPTTTWSGTMIAIPRHARDPGKSWKLIETLYLSRAGMTAQVADLGILPAVSDFWSSPVVSRPDPMFADGQPVNALYASLADRIPAQHITPDTAYATSALGYVLTQAVGAIRDGNDVETLRHRVAAWLASRQADVERQIEHGRFPVAGERAP